MTNPQTVSTGAQEPPTPGERRRAVLDSLLKGVDTSIGIVAIIAGVFALVAPPPTIIREVALPWLIVGWGVGLTIGGFAFALGRLTGIWIVETSGIVAAFFGTLIYLVVVASAILDELGVVVAVSLILIALLGMARRYLELQAFLSEPGDSDALVRIADLFKLRTEPRA